MGSHQANVGCLDSVVKCAWERGVILTAAILHPVLAVARLGKDNRRRWVVGWQVATVEAQATRRCQTC